MIQHLIWDVDGTLFDTYPAIARAFHAGLHDLGVTASFDWILSLAQITLDHCLATLATTYALSTADLEDRFAQHYRTVTSADQPPFPSVREVCTAIQARGGLNLIVTHRGRSSLDRLLAAHQLTSCFADIISNDDAYPRKPDPAAFVALIDRQQLPRETTLGLGDRDIDILAAQGAGLRAALFGTNQGTATPDFTFTDYAQLLRRITAEESLPL
ncbi:Phosphoglycolate phosphatase [Thermoflexales bacterium]|nr:Phosphoglycolate phosphatase [Thermoflexales bacterium]